MEVGLLIWPVGVEPKSYVVGETVGDVVGGGVLVPVPVSVVSRWLLLLSQTRSVALLFPVAVGLKVAVMVQVCPVASVMPFAQVPAAAAKSFGLALTPAAVAIR